MKRLRPGVRVAAAVAMLAGVLPAGTARSRQIYGYPQKGQSQQQQQQDQAECHGWALQQSGYNLSLIHI